MIVKMSLNKNMELDVISDRVHIKMLEFNTDLLIEENHDVLAEIIYDNILYVYSDRKECTKLIKNYLKQNIENINTK